MNKPYEPDKNSTGYKLAQSYIENAELKGFLKDIRWQLARFNEDYPCSIAVSDNMHMIDDIDKFLENEQEARETT